MTYILKRRVKDHDLYLACHDTPWGWWQLFKHLAVRFATRSASEKRLRELGKWQPPVRIVRLRVSKP